MLGLGSDGHIVSLFPKSDYLITTGVKVTTAFGPVWPNKRLTVTADVIRNRVHVLLLARGSDKGKVLAKAMKDPENITELPVRMILDRDWIMYMHAYRSFKELYKD
jgi:6-phosphogluconolactonase/glucosamine-6-phosphate isomerase/deaminase